MFEFLEFQRITPEVGMKTKKQLMEKRKIQYNLWTGIQKNDTQCKRMKRNGKEEG